MHSSSWKQRLHTSQAIDRGLHTPRTQQHLQLHCNFFSKQCGYSKGEHMSYLVSILGIVVVCKTTAGWRSAPA